MGDGGEGVRGTDDLGELPGQVFVQAERAGQLLWLGGVAADGGEHVKKGAAEILQGCGGLVVELGRGRENLNPIANRLLRRVRDYAEVRGDGTISHATARDGLAVFGVDGRGLDKVDRAILHAICQQFGGGPVGLSTVAISVGEQPETVEDMYEPFLIQQGLIARTPRGRIAMPAAWQHIGLTPPAPGSGPSLFD